jgi:hypothetical protein
MTSNGVGTSAWRSTMADLDNFGSQLSGDSDDERATSHQRRRPDTYTAGLQRLGGMFSVSSVPSTCIMMRSLTALARLQDEVVRLGGLSSPVVLEAFQRLLSSDVCDTDSRATGNVRVIRKSLLTSSNSRKNGSTSLQAAQLFDAFDIRHDSSIVAKAFEAAVAYLRSPRLREFVRYVFTSVSVQVANIHVAEFQAFLKMADDVAFNHGNVQITAARPASANVVRSADQKATAETIYSELQSLCEAAFPAPHSHKTLADKKTGEGADGSQSPPTSPRVLAKDRLVELLSWKDFRDLILTRCHHLSTVVTESML